MSVRVSIFGVKRKKLMYREQLRITKILLDTFTPLRYIKTRSDKKLIYLEQNYL